MTELPPGTPYKGPSRIASKSPWLASEDLNPDRDTVVTIEAIVQRNNVAFDEGRRELIILSARFQGKKREMVLNATNRKTLAMLSGSKACGAWFGLTIALYVKPDCKLVGGGKGPGIRIRNRRPDAPPDTRTEQDELDELAKHMPPSEPMP